jgi:hypothetical protein
LDLYNTRQQRQTIYLFHDRMNDKIDAKALQDLTIEEHQQLEMACQKMLKVIKENAV